MTWQFNPYAIPLFMSGIPLVIILYVAWGHRANLAARMFLGFTGAALGLVLTYGLELLSANLDAMLFWLRFEYFFHWGSVFWPLFAIAYSGYESWLTRRRILAFFIVPAITLALVWTNSTHGLIWSRTDVAMVGSLAMFDRSYGFAFWIWMAYLGAMVLLGDWVLIRKAVRSPRHFQDQLGWLIVAFFIPAIAITLTIARLTPIPQLDLSPYGVALACIPIAISLFRFHLFELIPAAYELVIESMGDAVIVCDADMRVVQVNSAAAQLAGRPAAVLVGCPVEQMVADIADLRLEQRILDANGVYREIAVLVGDSLRYFDLRISPLRNHQMVVTGQVLVLRDITDRKRVEQQSFDLAVERERVHVLETFIQDASHDFRTPISVILTSSYLLDRLGEDAGGRLRSLSRKSAEGAPETLDRSLLEIADEVGKMRDKALASRASAERLEKLVESILEVVQLERTPQLALVPLDLNRVVSEYVQINSAAAARNRQILHFVPDATLPPVPVDEWKLGRAMQKLIDNAIQYTPSDGAITVSTHQRDGEAVIQVDDTGIGINPDELPHIFEPFYRADRARSDTTGGAGMGLSIARRIVEAHRGQIEAESTVGKGSVFRITLPLAPNAVIAGR